MATDQSYLERSRGAEVSSLKTVLDLFAFLVKKPLKVVLQLFKSLVDEGVLLLFVEQMAFLCRKLWNASYDLILLLWLLFVAEVLNQAVVKVQYF